MDNTSVHTRFEELRSRAEELLRGRDGKPVELLELDILSLIHELEVHQIELQMQNEELRRTQLELEESRCAYSDLFNLAPVGYLTTTKEGIITGANLAASEILRIPKNRLTDRGFSSFIHAEDHKTYFRMLLDAAKERAPKHTLELRLLRASNVSFYARVDVAPSSDGSGQFNGWRIIFTDITDRKNAEAELKSYAERLERSNRELQDFAFIASHDLQEPLRKIQAFGDRLMKKFAPSLGEEGLDYLKRMYNAANRLQSMVQGLLDYSRVTTQGASFASVDLGRVVQGIVSDLAWQIEKNAATVLAESLPTIEADSNQMHQLFQNLISNALKFHGKKECLIKIQSERAESTGPEERGHWRIFVEDNGIGFDQDNAERIFFLFERLHGRSAFEGSGMGLAICRRIVERHGGTITARAEKDKGATFIITLPAKQKSPA